MTPSAKGSFDSLNKPKGVKRIYLATLNSIRAIKWLCKNEAAFKQELLLLAIGLPVSFFLDITVLERMLLISSIILILLAEVLNTAIEVIVDRIGLEMHPLSGLAKDLGSAAVTLCIGLMLFMWVSILFFS